MFPAWWRALRKRLRIRRWLVLAFVSSAVAGLLFYHQTKPETPVLAAVPEVKPPPPPSHPTPYLSPEESLKHFQLPPGYRLEPVVTDPVIQDPVAVAFDGDGRMYVAEMRTFMLDLNSTDARKPVSRISLHVSTKGDGVYDRHTVFVDHLLQPRMILPVADGVLVGESWSNDIWWYQDTDGDGVADKKTRVYIGGPRDGNIEHQPSGLLWSIDNWMYLADADYRLRMKGTKIVSEQIGANGGQWGLSQDDRGKLWFVNAGMETGPVNFQRHILYGAYSVEEQLAPDFTEVWPLPSLPDVQGGEKRLRAADGTLNHFTSTCGPEIFRGNRLPTDLRGDLLFAEPVGRLIRRAKVEDHDGVTYLRNAYEKSEFIRSDDPNFRPVNLATGPDGCLYIVDMYRGIIQEGEWILEGSHLRNTITEHQLDKNHGRGRIWRLVHQDFLPEPLPRLQHATTTELVEALGHANGWRRDTAQKLLVLHADFAAVPLLERTLRTSTNHFARVHALWTLEGLGALTATHVRVGLRDVHPDVRFAALRACESLFHSGNQELSPDIIAMAADADSSVATQAVLTISRLKLPDAHKIIREAAKHFTFMGAKMTAEDVIRPRFGEGSNDDLALKALLLQGKKIYQELCFACHGMNGEGTPRQGAPKGQTLAPPLVNSPAVLGPPEYLVAVLLRGFQGPVNGQNYDAPMLALAEHDDKWIAAVASYARFENGNGAAPIRDSDVQWVRSSTAWRKTPWTHAELVPRTVHRIAGQSRWRVTASHNEAIARLAVDGDAATAYCSKDPQTPGMWFKLELPEETMLSGIILDARRQELPVEERNASHEFPHHYSVELSRDGVQWFQQMSAGVGYTPVLEIRFPRGLARYVRITLVGEALDPPWTISNLELLAPATSALREAPLAVSSNSPKE